MERFILTDLFEFNSKEKTYYCACVYDKNYHNLNQIFLNIEQYEILSELEDNCVDEYIEFSYNRKDKNYQLSIK